MRNVLLIFLIFIPIISFSTNYYISNSGNDTNNGTSKFTAWQSIEKVNAEMSLFSAGDSILFERGGIFKGELLITSSGDANNTLYFGAFGTGEKPIIDGSEAIGSWNIVSGNIWSASCSSFSKGIHSILINDEYQAVGRFPNTSYNIISSTSGETQITDDDLSSPDGHWNGGEIVIKVRRWYLNRLDIISSSGNTINFTENKPYNIIAGFGYFIQNHINTLDLNNEWAFDKSSRELFIIKTDNTNPNEQNIEGDFYESGINVSMAEYITIENIHCYHQRLYGIYINQGEYININNCKISYSAGGGIKLYGSSNTNINNNEILHTSDDAIYLKYGSDVNITNNTIKNTGTVVGAFAGQGIAINVNLRGTTYSDILIQNNTIDSTGYIGIMFMGKNIKIKNNYVNHSLLVLDDGGGIYTYKNTETGNEIIDNIVLNSVGTDDGTKYHNPEAAIGIYLDDMTKGIKVHGNTVAYCGRGIFLHNARDIEITNNTVFRNRNIQLSMSQDASGHGEVIRNNIVENNVFFGGGHGELVYSLSTHTTDDTHLFGTFTNNYAYNPYDSVFVKTNFAPRYPTDNTKQVKMFTLGEWETATGISTNDKATPVFFGKEYAVTNVIGTNLITFNPNFDTDVRNWRGVGFAPPKLSYETDVSFLGSPCMKVEFKDYSRKVNVYNYKSFLNIEKNNLYEISFSIVGDDFGEVEIKVANSGADGNYKSVGNSTYFQFSETPKKYSFLFNPTANSIPEGAWLIFSFDVMGSTVWIDSVSIKEVEADLVNKDDYLSFYNNPTNSNVNIDFDSPLRNIDWELVSDASILPFKSEIFMFDETATGIDLYNESVGRNITIFPNPASEQVFIQTKGANIERVVIFNLQGQIVLNAQPTSNKINVNLLPDGLYIISVKLEGETFNTKLIINREY